MSFGDECHFDFVGKWGIRKWARIPKQLYDELVKSQTSSPYVFGGFTDQLRKYHKRRHPAWRKPSTRNILDKALGW